jgi:hypothetical protein
MDKLFHFFMDDGHGWVKVEKQLLKTLGIEKNISSYSYMKGDVAYLEEDSDASKFHRAFGKMFMADPQYINHTVEGRSSIRQYENYKVG